MVATHGVTLRLEEEAHKAWKMSGESSKTIFERGLRYGEITQKLERRDIEISNFEQLVKKYQKAMDRYEKDTQDLNQFIDEEKLREKYEVFLNGLAKADTLKIE